MPSFVQRALGDLKDRNYDNLQKFRLFKMSEGMLSRLKLGANRMLKRKDSGLQSSDPDHAREVVHHLRDIFGIHIELDSPPSDDVDLIAPLL